MNKLKIFILDRGHLLTSRIAGCVLDADVLVPGGNPNIFEKKSEVSHVGMWGRGIVGVLHF